MQQKHHKTDENRRHAVADVHGAHEVTGFALVEEIANGTALVHVDPAAIDSALEAAWTRLAKQPHHFAKKCHAQSPAFSALQRQTSTRLLLEKIEHRHDAARLDAVRRAVPFVESVTLNHVRHQAAVLELGAGVEVC